jgi:uncharacterized membrane protein SpoIIM required for sporulation
MNEQAFVEKREEDWQRLTKLCDIADSGATRLSADQVQEFVRVYRRVSTDLASVRTQSSNTVLIDFLNDLVGRAYGTLYRAPRAPLWASIMNGVTLSAQTFRRNRWFVFVSAMIFFSSGFLSYLLLRVVPDTREIFVPRQMEASFAQWKQGSFSERSSSESIAMTGFYAQNNPRTAIIAGAVGAGTFGMMSIYLLFQNGAVIGSLAHEVEPAGKLDFLFSSITPHGVPELSGIIVSGAAGLLLGWALINPGRRTRARALHEVGKDAVVLLSTSVILMFIAAPIEGFFSFNPTVPGFAKVTVAVISVCAWAAFWSRFGLSDEEQAAREIEIHETRA